MRRYSTFCLAADVEAFPVTLHSVVLWMGDSVIARKRASSIMTDVYNMFSHCKSRRIPYLAIDGERTKFQEFRRGLLANEHRPARRPKPVTAFELVQLAAHVDTSSIAEVQLWLAVITSYRALLRPGTLCDHHLLRKHVHFEEDAFGSVRLDVHKIKTLRLCTGPSPVWLRPRSSPSPLPPNLVALLSPSKLLKGYFHRIGIYNSPSAPLFPKLNSMGTATRPFKPLSYPRFLKKFKSMCSKAGVAPRSLQALRAGGRTDLTTQLLPEQLINTAGRWVPNSTVSPTYNRPDARVFNVIQTAFDRELDHAFRCLASTT